ncbi:phage tail protein [Acinetobacter gerneri]|uniref:phage tail-collar fiber domain-containing protein n=1 Tax=Acinetobacter gerneri TaxID=202952 RepID=UPI002935CE69|nr:phage tail protein [Acinetobacter gerneri]MDV2439939.1 phage tail protein [Acinetobacter gerneri]
MSEYYSVTTKVGDAAIANAITNNKKLNITHVAFGDGNGSVPTPDKNRTALVREVHRQAVNKYTQHETVANWITVEVIIPSNIGGFYIREVGIIADGVLISDGSVPPTFKEATNDGVREYRLRLTIDIQSADVVSLILDESLIYASQKWVEENYIRRNEIVDNLTSDDAKKPLSAKQGKVLQDTKFKANGALRFVPMNGDVDWNENSGVYQKDLGGATSTIIHFRNNNGSCPAVQFRVNYANGGISYRSARDSFGFEKDWEQLVTVNGATFTGAISGTTASFSGTITAGNVSTNEIYSKGDIKTDTWIYAAKFVGSLQGDVIGNADSATKLQNPRSIFGQTFDGSSDISGNVTSSTGMFLADQYHYIDVGKDGIDRMNFASYGGVFNFINPATGIILARITADGIDCNAASATKLKNIRTINGSNFDGTQNLEVSGYYGVVRTDNRIVKPIDTPKNQLGVFFTSYGGLNSGSGNTLYGDLLSLNTYNDASGGHANSLFFSKTGALRVYHFRAEQNATAWGDPKILAYTNDSVDFTITKNSAKLSLISPDVSTAQIILNNDLRSIALATAGVTGDFKIWDSTNGKSLISFSKDGNNLDVNQYINVITPLGVDNSTGTASFSVSGGESSPIKFKINRSGSIKKNAAGEAAINHALSFNWYDTEWQIGNVRGGSKDSIGFGLTKGNDTLVWRHDGATQFNYGNIIASGGYITASGNITGADLITTTGRISAPTNAAHYIDIGKDGTDLTTFAQYGGMFKFIDTSNANANVVTITTADATFSPRIVTKPTFYAATLSDLGSGNKTPICIPKLSVAKDAIGYAPFIHGSVDTVGIGYVSQISIGAVRGSNTWHNSGAYIAIGGKDTNPVEDFKFLSGGWMGTSGGQLNILGTLYAPTLTSSNITTTNINISTQLAMTAAPGGGTNNGLYPGNGDGASLATANFDIRTHYGLGIRDNNGNRNIVFNARTGDAVFAGQVYLGSGTTSASRLLGDPNHLQVLTEGGAAKGLATGGILSSDSYIDWSNVPTNGIYSKGDIKTATWMYALRYVGSAGGDATFQGALTGNAGSATKLQTARTVSFSGAATGSFNFDGSQNITCSLSNPDLDILPYLPQPYPKAIPPSGYLSLAGQTITQSQYPNLYALYGATLPDMRGEFIRGFDNGRGVDLGRSILSWQDDDLRSHTHSYFQVSGGGGGQTSGGGSSYNREVSTSKTGGTETRPRNISFNYIVKAG